MPIAYADVGRLEGRRVVHAIAGHRDDMALAPKDLDETDLVLGRDSGDDPDVVDPAISFLVRECGELGAGDRLALDAELAGDRPEP